MQDIHSIVGGRVFGATTSGDRRLRPLHHHHHSNHHHQQALKCPRCESLNTKFCYYNNYNLSQPRHFCKSCRRYWTKGGVLRNVPVGGGCRKNKRSKPKNNPSTPALSAGEPSHMTVPPLPAAEKLPHPAEPKSSPPSSSESSSITGVEAAMPVSAPAPTSVSASEMLGMGELRSVVTTSADPSTCGPVFEHALLEQLGTAGDNNGIFTENNGNGGFTGMMMTSSWNEPFSVGSNGILLNQHNPWFHEDKLQGISSGFLDQTVENRSGEGDGGFGALDWHPSGGENDQGLFDLPNAVDQAYWSHTQWTDQDNPNLYIP